jgi:hypothetical protein
MRAALQEQTNDHDLRPHVGRIASQRLIDVQLGAVEYPSGVLVLR